MMPTLGGMATSETKLASRVDEIEINEQAIKSTFEQETPVPVVAEETPVTTPVVEEAAKIVEEPAPGATEEATTLEVAAVPEAAPETPVVEEVAAAPETAITEADAAAAEVTAEPKTAAVEDVPAAPEPIIEAATVAEAIAEEDVAAEPEAKTAPKVVAEITVEQEAVVKEFATPLSPSLKPKQPLRRS